MYKKTADNNCSVEQQQGAFFEQLPGDYRKFEKNPLTLRIELLHNKTNPPKNTIF